jgi:hypothetical protein
MHKHSTFRHLASKTLGAVVLFGLGLPTASGTVLAADTCTVTWSPSTVGVGEQSTLTITDPGTLALEVFTVESGGSSAFYAQYLYPSGLTSWIGSAAIGEASTGSFTVTVRDPFDSSNVYCSGTLTVVGGGDEDDDEDDEDDDNGGGGEWPNFYFGGNLKVAEKAMLPMTR